MLSRIHFTAPHDSSRRNSLLRRSLVMDWRSCSCVRRKSSCAMHTPTSAGLPNRVHLFLHLDARTIMRLRRASSRACDAVAGAVVGRAMALERERAWFLWGGVSGRRRAPPAMRISPSAEVSRPIEVRLSPAGAEPERVVAGLSAALGCSSPSLPNAIAASLALASPSPPSSRMVRPHTRRVLSRSRWSPAPPSDWGSCPVVWFVTQARA